MKRQQFVIRNNDSSSINNNGLLQFFQRVCVTFFLNIRKCCIKRFQFNAASRKRDFVTIFTRRDRAIKIRVVKGRTYVGRSVFRGSWRFVTSVSTGALTRFSPRQWFLPVLLLSRYSLKRCVKSAPLWNNFDFFPSSLTEDYARRVENCQASRTRKWRFERGVLKIFPILFSILETKESSTFHTVHLKNYLQLESISNSRIIANPTIFRRSIY